MCIETYVSSCHQRSINTAVRATLSQILGDLTLQLHHRQEVTYTHTHTCTDMFAVQPAAHTPHLLLRSCPQGADGDEVTVAPLNRRGKLGQKDVRTSVLHQCRSSRAHAALRFRLVFPV